MPHRPPGDKMEGIGHSSFVWRKFMTLSLHAVIFLGTDSSENLHSTEVVRCDSNIDPRTRFGDLGSVRIKLDYFKLGEAAFGKPQGGHPAHEGKKFMCSLTMHCVLSEYLSSNIYWENRLSWFQSTPQYRELDGIDGEPLEFEWRMFPGHTTLQILQEIQTLMREWNSTPH